MSESLLVAAIVLFALLVGAVLPVLFSLRSFLRRTEQAVEGLERRAGTALDQTTVILHRVDTMVQELQGGAPAVHNIVQIANDLSETLRQTEKSIRMVLAVGAAAGPAVAAFVRRMGDGDNGDAAPPADGGDAPEAAAAAGVTPAGVNPSGQTAVAVGAVATPKPTSSAPSGTDPATGTSAS